MKNYKIFRILTAPFLFLMYFGGLTLFLGPLCLMLGIKQCLSKLIGYQEDEEWDELLFFTFGWVAMPWVVAREYILTGEILD